MTDCHELKFGTVTHIYPLDPFPLTFRNFKKSSTVAEVGDRYHNRHGPKRWGWVLCPFRAEVGPHLNNVAWAEVYFRTKWRLHPSSHLATLNTGQKLGGSGCALCSGGSWVPITHKVAWAEAYLHTKCYLSPSSLLATRDIGRKLGDCAPLGEGKLGPHLTQSRLG